jgi:serine phosphatase RsbU (regulator of sigma subunit)
MISGPLSIGIAERARSGEDQSGDRCVVAANGARVLVGVIDGVGHGAEAARAAAAAAAVLEGFALESVDALLQRCHTRLRETRGAAITLAVIDTAAHSLEWVGAGNVVAVLQQIEPFGLPNTRELLVRSGAAGDWLPSTQSSRLPMARGDTLVMATDGVYPKFINDLSCSEAPQQLADRLLKRYAMLHDDALVVVARMQATES